ncbi:MAG: hypothetical protein FWD31_11225 [Planctomycetaceae bacterium]|nr:hypothetical protein [Planctomycetaceae bacterium]
METQPNTSSLVTRVVIVLGIVSLLGMIGYGVFLYNIKSKPVYWRTELFYFRSGSACFVFCEPKLTIFCGDGGVEDVFDTINVHVGGSDDARIAVSDFGSIVRSGGEKFFSSKTQRGKTTMRFYDGKCVMVVSHRGTKLSLADGRQFILDGQTPLLLRCKADGTIVQLNELPEGFVEFCESPPTNAGLNDVLKELYPKAFQ